MAHGGYAVVGFAGLCDDWAVLAHRHAAKFVDQDLLAVETVPALLEQDRPRRG